MQTQTQLEHDRRVEEKIRKVKELYANAPELGQVALEKGLPDLTREMAAATGKESAGRVGARQGQVSELTSILTFAEGGAKRLRGLLQLLEGNFKGADAVGTLHDMRFVFLDNDTRILFATTYDGEWSPYIDDFATHIPDELDVMFSNCEGWPGVRSPAVKDYIAKYQHTASGWYVASPNVTVKDQWKLEKVGAAVEEFLDKIA